MADNSIVDRPEFHVFVRDRGGWPIPGAKIEFAVNGQSGFEVANTEGRGSIAGIKRSDQLTIRAEYEGEIKEATPAPDVDEWTFQFNVDVRQEPKWFPAAGALFGVATFASLFYLLIGPEIPAGRTFIFNAWLAFCIAASAAFLGGTAVARGTVKIPFMKVAPTQFVAYGGIGVFVVVFLILVAANH